MKATEPEVQAELAKLTKSFGGDAQMNAALASRGLDRSGLNRELEKSLTVAKFIQETVAKKITITPAELSQYYDQHKEQFRHPDLVHTSHILILVKADATPEQEGHCKTASRSYSRAGQERRRLREARNRKFDGSCFCLAGWRHRSGSERSVGARSTKRLRFPCRQAE